MFNKPRSGSAITSSVLPPPAAFSNILSRTYGDGTHTWIVGVVHSCTCMYIHKVACNTDICTIMAPCPSLFLMLTSIPGWDRSALTQLTLLSLVYLLSSSSLAAKCRAVLPSWWVNNDHIVNDYNVSGTCTCSLHTSTTANIL